MSEKTFDMSVEIVVYIVNNGVSNYVRIYNLSYIYFIRKYFCVMQFSQTCLHGVRILVRNHKYYKDKQQNSDTI